jgi:hypothetical protein
MGGIGVIGLRGRGRGGDVCIFIWGVYVGLLCGMGNGMHSVVWRHFACDYCIFCFASIASMIQEVKD